MKQRAASLALVLCLLAGLFVSVPFTAGAEETGDSDVYYEYHAKVLTYLRLDMQETESLQPAANCIIHIYCNGNDLDSHMTDVDGNLSFFVLKTLADSIPGETEIRFEPEQGYQEMFWGGPGDSFPYSNPEHTFGDFIAGQPVNLYFQRGGWINVSAPFDCWPAEQILPASNSELAVLSYRWMGTGEGWVLGNGVVGTMTEDYRWENWSVRFIEEGTYRFAFSYNDKSVLQGTGSWTSEDYVDGIFQWYNSTSDAASLNEAETVVVTAGKDIEINLNSWIGDRAHAAADTYPPHLTYVNPIGVDNPAAGTVTIWFDEEMQSGGETVTLSRADGLEHSELTNIMLEGDGVSFTASYEGLSAGRLYNVTVSGFKDIAGNTMETPADTFSFAVEGGRDNRELADIKTGIKIEGLITPDATLEDVPGYAHDAGTDDACDAIHDAEDSETLLALHDISITGGGYSGPIRITIPIPEGFNGREITILHCNHGQLERLTATVENNSVTFELMTLSPIGVVLADTSGGPSISNNASLGSTTVSFDKYGGGNVSVILNPGDYTLAAVKKGGSALVKGTDYRVSVNTITILKDYLASLATGMHTLIFDMSGGTDPVLIITVNDTAPPTGATPSYSVISHFNDWSGSGSATAKIDGDHTEFIRLLLSGSAVDSNDYSVSEGSTVITLKESYLKTLAAGTHIFVAEFSDGESGDITLTVSKTDEFGNTALWVVLVLAVMIFAVCLIVWLRRHGHAE
ncbi:MAG: Ig-like domain-containing protein [Candidatus Methanoplasma sp.]|nr:Ig-like domain-containing protein [Candidatus Methanoplasma sp.]